MARPKKTKVERVCVPPSDPVFPALAAKHLSRLSVDPTMAESMADLGFADLITGSANERTREITGFWMNHVLSNAPIGAVEEFFRRLIHMRREHDRQASDKGRNWNCLKGYLDYLTETGGREPSKPELASYLLARPGRYFNLPSVDDKKGWSRMRAETGLNKLRDR